MQLRNGAWSLVLFVLLFGGLMSCRAPISTEPTAAPGASGAATGTRLPAAAARWINDLSELPKGAVNHVDVVYFHRTERCVSCLNAEAYTRETLTKYFPDQMSRGRISLYIVDVEKTENVALVRKFDAAGSALYLSILVQETEYLYPNQDIWFYTENKYLFVNTLRKKLESLVGGA
jgi:hypothetical protein